MRLRTLGTFVTVAALVLVGRLVSVAQLPDGAEPAPPPPAQPMPADAPAAGAPAAPAVTPEVARVRSRFDALTDSDPRLRGAWVDVAEPQPVYDDGDGKMHLTPIFDPARETEQRAGLTAALAAMERDGLLRKDGYVVEKNLVGPVSDLVRKLQAWSDDPASGLGGSRVFGAYYEAADENAGATPPLFLSLDGYVTGGQVLVGGMAVDKAEAFAAKAEELMAADPRWQTLEEARDDARISINKDPLQSVLDVVAIAPADLPPADQPRVQAAQNLRRRVHDALRTDTALHGVWVDVTATYPAGDPQGLARLRSVLEPRFDTDEKLAATQRAAFAQLLKVLEEDGLFRPGVDVVVERAPWPYRRLMDSLADAVEQAPELDDALVGDAYFAPPPDASAARVALVPVGRVAGPEDAMQVVELADALLAQAPVWSGVQAVGSSLNIINLADIEDPIQQALRQAVQETATLHGAWIEVDAELLPTDVEGDDPRLVFRPIFDKKQQAVQQAALKTLAARLAGEREYTIAEPTLIPFSEFLADLKQAIAESDDLENATVCDGYFTGLGPAGLTLALVGRVTKEDAEDQKETIATLAEETAAAHDDLGPVVPEPEKLITVAVNENYLDPVQSVLRQEVASDPLLHGAWVDVDVELTADDCEGDEPVYVLDPILDRDRADEQKKVLSGLMDVLTAQVGEQHAATPTYRFGEPRLVPFSDLLETARERIHETPALDQCTVCDGYFKPSTSPGQLDLVLLGRVTEDRKAQQVEAIVSLVEDLMIPPMTWEGVLVEKDKLAENVVDPAATAAPAWEPFIEAVRQRETLHGSWVKVKVDYDPLDCQGDEPIFHVMPTFDANEDAAATQKQAFQETLAEVVEQGWLPRVRTEVDDQPPWPVEALIEDLNDRMEEEGSGLENCVVWGAYFTLLSEDAELRDDAQNDLRMVLIGRVARESQKAEIVRLCAELMRENGTWEVPDSLPTIQTTSGGWPDAKVVRSLRDRTGAIDGRVHSPTDFASGAARSIVGSRSAPTTIAATVPVAFLQDEPAAAEQLPPDDEVQVVPDAAGLEVVDPSKYETDLRSRLQAAMCGEEELHGAWADVRAVLLRTDRTGEHPKYIFSPMYDSARRRQHATAFRKLVDRLVEDPESPVEITKPKLRPVTELLGQLQDRLEQTPGAEGILIQGACFMPLVESEYDGPVADAPADPAPRADATLALYGRIAGEDQRALVNSVYQELIDSDDAVWNPAEDGFSLGTFGLVVVRPSEVAAARFFSNGIDHFRNCEFEQAHQAFRLANVEAGGSAVYQYWMAVTELKMNQDQRAYDRIVPIVRRFREGTESYDPVLSSLEPIQFTLRQRLTRLEDMAWAVPVR